MTETSELWSNLSDVERMKIRELIRRPAVASDSGESFYRPTSWQREFSAIGANSAADLIGLCIPGWMMIMREEAYGASLTPKGAFITQVAPQGALRAGWLFVREKTQTGRRPLSPRLHDRLVRLTQEFHLKRWFIAAIQIMMTFGRALFFVRQVNPPGRVQRWQIHVVPIWDEYIEYDDVTGDVRMFRPLIRVGRGYQQFDVPPENAVLWVNRVDPFGNIHEGFPDIIPVYRTILRSETIADNYADLIAQKGMGHLDISIANIVTEEDAKRWADVYKSMVRDSVVVHNPEMETSVVSGISSGYNYPETQNSYYEDTASATGMPQMRMRGVQSGAVTGSEVDQDNAAEVYSIIQERAEPYMKQVYMLLDRVWGNGVFGASLQGKTFEIEWEFNVKMDQRGRSVIFGQEMASVLQGSEILTVDQAMMRLGLPVLGGEEGDMMLQAWIKQNFPEEYGMMEEEAEFTDVGEQRGHHEENALARQEAEAAKQRKRNIAPPTTGQVRRMRSAAERRRGDADVEELTDDEVIVQQMMEQSRDEIINSPDFTSVALDTVIPKEIVAMRLLSAGTSLKRTNEILRAMFDSGGMSMTTLARIRDTLDQEDPEEDFHGD